MADTAKKPGKRRAPAKKTVEPDDVEPELPPEPIPGEQGFPEINGDNSTIDLAARRSAKAKRAGADEPAQMQLAVPTPTSKALRLKTIAITLPAEVGYGMHDEFDVTLRCRIEQLSSAAPRDEFGNVKRSALVYGAKVLSYVGDDFNVSVEPDEDDDPED